MHLGGCRPGSRGERAGHHAPQPAAAGATARLRRAFCEYCAPGREGFLRVPRGMGLAGAPRSSAEEWELSPLCPQQCLPSFPGKKTVCAPSGGSPGPPAHTFLRAAPGRKSWSRVWQCLLCWVGTLPPLEPHNSLSRLIFSPFFMDKETKVRRSQKSCPRRGLLEPASVCPKALVFPHTPGCR